MFAVCEVERILLITLIYSLELGFLNFSPSLVLLVNVNTSLNNSVVIRFVSKLLFVTRLSGWINMAN